MANLVKFLSASRSLKYHSDPYGDIDWKLTSVNIDSKIKYKIKIG